MLRERVASAAVFVPVVLALLLVGQPWLTLLVGALVVLAARETFSLLDRAGHPNEPLVGAALSLAFVAAATSFTERPGLAALVVAAAPMFAGAAAFRHREPRVGVQVWLGTLFGALYCALLAFLLLVVEAAPSLPPGSPLAGRLDAGRAWLLLLVLSVWAFDTVAYVVGRLVGRHRFLVHLSPGKTWEGVAGGTLGAVAVGAVALPALGAPSLAALALGPLIALTAQAGDLAESMLKRAAGAKDASALIPGHGGVLDRLDSLLFAAPAAYLYLLATGAR